MINVYSISKNVSTLKPCFFFSLHVHAFRFCSLPLKGSPCSTFQFITSSSPCLLIAKLYDTIAWVWYNGHLKLRTANMEWILMKYTSFRTNMTTDLNNNVLPWSVDSFFNLNDNLPNMDVLHEFSFTFFFFFEFTPKTRCNGSVLIFEGRSWKILQYIILKI